ncbi:O-fucosyltransferase family protein [Diplocloster modestus]|uniref:Uncharacterized protein n=1 Tax=Diplocloster modestus TaxID=2850322 RepID=A0ABS6K2F2_9FIRM|nr:hypothetical protein [Diplocloster modestus]MBU9724574.1 hypothetical protein [Diplocloster modestus]
MGLAQKLRAVRTVFIAKTRNKSYYYRLYRAYRFAKRHPVKGNRDVGHVNYLAARPNPDSGIGHQMANWIAGYYFAQVLGLNFAHMPFASSKWEKFLGFGEGEITLDELVKRQHYKKVRIPHFNEANDEEMAAIREIVDAYAEQKVVFLCEQDQFYKAQFGVMQDLQRKFYSASARRDDHLIYRPEEFNIAVHVRRGDIVIGQTNNDPGLTKRWQDNSYFLRVLEQALTLPQLPGDKPVAVYLFSQGEKQDFPEFADFLNLHYCLDMGPIDSFLHMVNADLLITSKSSFSYKPALLNRGLKICPQNFWHGYPEDPNWILADDTGAILPH